MKKSIVIILLVVAICVSFPVQALSGTVYHQLSYTGLRGLCTGYIKGPYYNNEMKAKITISLVDGENHLPPDDYSCKASIMFCYTFNGDSLSIEVSKTGNLCAETNTYTTSVTVDSAEFSYFINGSRKYHEEF